MIIQDMDNNKFPQKIIILLIFFISLYNLNAQENKLFKEYIHLFTEVHLTDTYQKYDTIGIKNPRIKAMFLKFLDKKNQDTIATSPWLIFKIGKYYLAILSHQIEDFFVLENNRYYYYSVFYDEMGNMINSYKLLEGISEEQYVELFFSKNSIKYLLYSHYTNEKKVNCQEVIYEIKNNNSLEKLSDRNYQIEK
jgi:hypothetical protein